MGLLGWLPIKTLPLITPASAGAAAHLAVRDGMGGGQRRQRGLAPASLPGEVLAGYGRGGGSSLLVWQLPALPTAPFDPAGESRNLASGCPSGRNREKTAMPRVRKEPVLHLW